MVGLGREKEKHWIVILEKREVHNTDKIASRCFGGDGVRKSEYQHKVKGHVAYICQT